MQRRLAITLAAALLVACGQKPPSWDVLLAGKITGQYPDYRVAVTAPGVLTVTRPNLPTQTVDVPPIAQHCLRGPKDCNYAVEKMLLVLRDP
jgi:hypothetical protein